MKTRLLALVGTVLLLAGCQTPNLPKKARAVGGGLDIEWTAAGNGTVMLVETRSGRAVITRSVEAGEFFTFGPSDVSQGELILAMFGEPEEEGGELQLPRDTRFVLYFIPAD